MNLGLTPVTGVPLPFVSYGGSSMFAQGLPIGLLQAVYRRSVDPAERTSGLGLRRRTARGRRERGADARGDDHTRPRERSPASATGRARSPRQGGDGRLEAHQQPEHRASTAAAARRVRACTGSATTASPRRGRRRARRGATAPSRPRRRRPGSTTNVPIASRAPAPPGRANEFADPLGQQDVGGPAGRGDQGEHDAERLHARLVAAQREQRRRRRGQQHPHDVAARAASRRPRRASGPVNSIVTATPSGSRCSAS